MVLTQWLLRSSAEQINVYAVYGPIPNNYFSLEIHHGGWFTIGPGRQYINGKVNYIDSIDGDEFSVLELNAMLKELGYVKKIPMWYHFKAPDSDLDYGLHALGSDDDIRYLLKFIAKVKIIEVYIEQWKTSVHTYSQTPNRSSVVIKEVGSAPIQATKPAKKMVPKKKLFIETQPYVPMQVETEPGLGANEPGLGANEPRLGEMLNDDVFTDSFFTNEEAQEEGGHVGTGKEKEIDGVNQDDNSDEATSDTDEESEDSDFIIDDEHRINDVEIDMSDFRDNIDGDVEWVEHSPNVGTGKAQEIDGDIEQLNFDNLESSDSDEDDAVRKQGLKKLRREHTTNPNKKAHFYIGQVFGTKEEMREMVTMHSIETRRHLKIMKNDKRRFRVICEGIIPNFSEVVQPSQCGPGIETHGPKKIYIAKETTCLKPQVSPQGVRWVKKKTKERESQCTQLAKGKDQKCPWVLYISRSDSEQTWMVKTYKDNHKCLQSRQLRTCTSDFLAKQIQEELVPDSKVKATHLRDQLQKKFEIGFSKHKIYRAHHKAQSRIMGDHIQQYGMLRDYILELQACNPDTTVKLNFEPEPNPECQSRQFRRIYVCLGPLKAGFKAGRRDLLGLDGSFMKSPATGMLLTAVGVDPNHQTYPLAYGIVESENRASWTWFLECLGADLELDHMSNFTFINDRQKGIIPAIGQLFPCAEHRFCLKHIYDNMKGSWRGQVFKDFLWKAATAPTIVEFTKVMDDLKNVKKEVYDWLKEIPPRHWARSHFTGRTKCDVLLNNMCEVFNRQLIDGREKPIILCLEYIREYLMKRIAKVQKAIDKSSGPLTPKATEMFDAIKTEAAKYNATFNGGHKFQVVGPWMDQHVVDMANKSCTCRRWELTGMPCKHAVATIWNMAENQMHVGIPESFVDPVYWFQTWKMMYTYKIDPIKGRPHWPKSGVSITITPPKHKAPIGRPKKKRRKSVVELQMVKEGKISRAGAKVKCGNCKVDGHNKRTCPNMVGGSKGVGKKAGGSK